MDVKGRLIELAQGVAVEEDVYRIAQQIREYDPNLRIKYLAQHGQIEDAPYALFELCPDGQERLVFHIWELDQRVLERIEAADNQKRNVLVDLEGKNLLAKRNQQRRYEERRLEALDIVQHIVGSPKGRYTWKSDEGRKIQFDDSVNGYNGEVNERRSI